MARLLPTGMRALSKSEDILKLLMCCTILTATRRRFGRDDISGASIAVVDYATKKIVDTIRTKEPNVLRLRLSPDGRLAVVATDTGQNVLIVDVASRKIIKEIPIGKGGGGIVISPDSSRAFVSISLSNYVAVIDLKTLKLIGKIDAGPNPDGMWWVGE